QRSLLLARDALGIKPLYIARTGDALLFGSEVRAVLASGLVPRELDPQAVAGVLCYGCPQQPLTILKSVRSFPAGSYQTTHPGHVGSAPAPTKYWDFPDSDSTLSHRQAVDAIRTTLEAAVRDHLVADVPVGVFLSSGLDSTIVAALAARHTTHLRSFTVGLADQPALSEAPLASQTAHVLGMDPPTT